MLNKKALCMGLIAIIFFIIGIPAPADANSDVHRVVMEINSSQYLDLGRKIKRLAIANPKIADVSVLGASELNVVALDRGSTSLTVWLEDNSRISYMITVMPTDKAMAKEIERAIGLPNVTVEKVGDRILLKGTVRHQKEQERAVMIAAMYIEESGSINDDGSEGESAQVNLFNLLELESPVQINLEAWVLDISTAKTSNFGFQYANASSIAKSDTGYDITFGTVGTFNGGQNYAHFGKPFLNVDTQVQALVQDGDTRVLGRPNITTLSGKKAQLLIGGSIPLPTTDSDGGVNVSWKDYGISLNVEPTLDTENRITAVVDSEVSTLDYDHAVTTSVGTFPAMTKRTASAVVNLEDGSAMVIGGLLNSQDGKTIKKIPLLGDIPIIGEFFKHTSKTKDRRELVILIRPRLVSSDDPAKMSKQMKDMYQKGEDAANSREDVDINAPVESMEEIDAPFNNNKGIVDGDEEPQVAGANHINSSNPPLSEADAVLSEGAVSSAVTPESTESTTLENILEDDSDDDDLGMPLEGTESRSEAGAALPESNESNLMDQRADEASETSQDDTPSESKSDASNQDTSKDELIRKLAEQLKQVNELLIQVAEESKG